MLLRNKVLRHSWQKSAHSFKRQRQIWQFWVITLIDCRKEIASKPCLPNIARPIAPCCKAMNRCVLRKRNRCPMSFLSNQPRHPYIPIRPKILQNTILAAVIGLFLAIGIIYLVETLDDTLKDPEDIKTILSLPILGWISTYRS